MKCWETYLVASRVVFSSIELVSYMHTLHMDNFSVYGGTYKDIKPRTLEVAGITYYVTAGEWV
jgi:hypothetical protein